MRLRKPVRGGFFVCMDNERMLMRKVQEPFHFLRGALQLLHEERQFAKTRGVYFSCHQLAS